MRRSNLLCNGNCDSFYSRIVRNTIIIALVIVGMFLKYSIQNAKQFHRILVRNRQHGINLSQFVGGSLYSKLRTDEKNEKHEKVSAITVFTGLLLLVGATMENMHNNGDRKAYASSKQYDGSIALTRNFVADAVEKVAPAVVNIMSLESGLFTNSASFGSGFIFSRDGLIITNAHVVNGAEKVVVTFKNGHKKIASVKSKDDKSDVALIQIDEVNNLDEELPMVEIGTSSTLRPGNFL